MSSIGPTDSTPPYASRIEGMAMPCLASLIRSRESTGPEQLVCEVAERFERDRDLDAVAIVSRDRPVGLIVQTDLFLKLSHQFGHALYSRSPITQIADMAPLVVSQTLPLDQAIRLASERGAAHAYDNVIVVDDEGRFGGLLAMSELIEHQSAALQRIREEEQLSRERASELERIDDLRTSFLSNVTHELRAPVNAMVGATELVAQAHEKRDHETLDQLLPMLLASGTGLRQLINNVLDLSKIQAGKMVAIPERVALRPLLEDIRATATALAGRAPVEIAVHADGDELSVETDPIKLKQILLNLASNAVKFTNEGRITIGARGFSGGCSIWVEDTGEGIDHDDLPHLFDAFYQVEDPTIKRREGTGLGLAIVRDLVQLLGARLRVESDRGAGSLFEIELPARFSQGFDASDPLDARSR